MSYSTKNYTADGGNRTVIGGVLEIAGGTSHNNTSVLSASSQ